MTRGRWITGWLALVLIGFPACDWGGEVPRDLPASVVDTVFTADEEVRRFQATLGEAPAALSGGAGSMDDLVDRFVRALETADTLAFRPLLMTRAEFGYLYYPHTIFTAPPYFLPPDILWLQMENTTSRGFGRLVQRLFGRPLQASGYACEDDPDVQDRNRIWDECRFRMSPPGAEPYDFRLFGSIIERGGVFKFVSYANEL